MPKVKLTDAELVAYFKKMILDVLRHRRFVDGVDEDELSKELLIPERLKAEIWKAVKAEATVETIA